MKAVRVQYFVAVGGDGGGITAEGGGGAHGCDDLETDSVLPPLGFLSAYQFHPSFVFPIIMFGFFFFLMTVSNECH